MRIAAHEDRARRRPSSKRQKHAREDRCQLVFGLARARGSLELAGVRFEAEGILAGNVRTSLPADDDAEQDLGFSFELWDNRGSSVGRSGVAKAHLVTDGDTVAGSIVLAEQQLEHELPGQGGYRSFDVYADMGLSPIWR